VTPDIAYPQLLEKLNIRYGLRVQLVIATGRLFDF
jgi:hypothetical protein